MDALIQQIEEMRAVLEHSPELMSRTSERIAALESLKTATILALATLGIPPESNTDDVEDLTGE